MSISLGHAYDDWLQPPDDDAYYCTCGAEVTTPDGQCAACADHEDTLNDESGQG